MVYAILWLVFALIILFIVIWLVDTYILPAIPIGQPVKRAIMALIALAVVAWLVLYWFMPALEHVRPPG